MMSVFGPLLCRFWGHFWDQDIAGINWDVAVWSLSKSLGSAPLKHSVDILDPVWTALEQLAKLPGILRCLSSSTLPSQQPHGLCFCALLSKATPTAHITHVYFL